MKPKLGVRTPTDTLVNRLRLMADSGGMLTRDRIRTVIEAADRLQEYYDMLLSTKHDGGDDS